MTNHLVQELKLADELFVDLIAGYKQVTIRNGKRDIKPGPLVFTGVNDLSLSAEVNVTEVVVKQLSELTDREAQADGALNAEEMAEALKRFYPDIKPESTITIVKFKVADA